MVHFRKCCGSNFLKSGSLNSDTDADPVFFNDPKTLVRKKLSY
jgi:hypothetical protein